MIEGIIQLLFIAIFGQVCSIIFTISENGISGDLIYSVIGIVIIWRIIKALIHFKNRLDDLE